MNNMNGIISECQHIYNSEVEIKDTKNGATRAIAFYSNAKARIAEEKEKQEKRRPLAAAHHFMRKHDGPGRHREYDAHIKDNHSADADRQAKQNLPAALYPPVHHILVLVGNAADGPNSGYGNPRQPGLPDSPPTRDGIHAPRL